MYTVPCTAALKNSIWPHMLVCNFRKFILIHELIDNLSIYICLKITLKNTFAKAFSVNGV